MLVHSELTTISRGAPPAAHTPAFTACVTRSRQTDAGLTSPQVLTTPTEIRSSASSPKPTPRNISRRSTIA